MVMIFGCEVQICAGGNEFWKQSRPQWGIFHHLFWMNDFFVLFCWKSVMEFLHPVPWIGDFPVIVPYLNPRSMKRNKNIWKRRGLGFFFFSFFTLKIFQPGISGRPGGFAGGAKGILWGSRLAGGDSVCLHKAHLLSPLKPCGTPSPPFSSALPFSFSLISQGTFSESWERICCFWKWHKAETTWFEAAKWEQTSGTQGLWGQPWEVAETLSLPLQKLWVVI